MKLLKKSFAGIALLLACFVPAQASSDIEHADSKTPLMRDGLVSVGASATPGKLPIREAKDNVDCRA